MYQMIIVDDEEIIREGLADLIDWKEMGFQVVRCFEDGKKVIEYLKENSVDVVMTDIRMQEMTGIELSKYMYEQYPQIKVVILSGYKEFEYAKEAVQYNVEHYLLKPTDFEEVDAVFHKIKAKLDQERKKQEETSEAKGKYSELMETMREQFFMDLLMGALGTEADIRKRMELLGLPWNPDLTKCVIIHIHIRNYSQYIEKTWGYGKEKFSTAMGNFINGTKDCIEYFTVSHDDSRLTVIGVSSFYKNPVEMEAVIQSQLESVSKAVAMIMGLTVEGHIHSCYESLAEVSGSMGRLTQKWKEEDLKAGGIVKSEEYRYFVNKYKLCMTYISDGDIKALHNLVDSLIEDISILPIKTIHHLMIDLFAILTNKLLEIGISLTEEMQESVDYYDIIATQNVEEVREWLISVFRKIVKAYHEKRNTTVEYTIQRALRYMEDNYNRDISLEDVADQVFFNAAYLGRLLKKQLGENFTDYMTKIRMQKAIQLLRENRYKAYEISEIIGYKNSKYFYRVFKQYTGYTPKDYLRMTGEGES